ncbi:DUF2071 domain-containing protein [Actinoplanes octamycinicus]|nr:hypothetical protein Aoc01nite_73250 [Actinoplanes octamycinicus]
MSGVIERRLLINYRTDPDAVARLLPAGMRPQLINGHAVAGICLIRLGRLRPQPLPAAVGMRTENAAHRVAVEWDTPDGVASGVYIPRRDTDSWATTLAGGRLFPGEHHRARFDVDEDDRELRVAFRSTDGTGAVRSHVRITGGWPGSKLFDDLGQASDFFRRGCAGYSPTSAGRALDGMRLHSETWAVEAVELTEVHSTFFDRIPAEPDSAFLMRDLPVTWHSLSPMRMD